VQRDAYHLDLGASLRERRNCLAYRCVGARVRLRQAERFFEDADAQTFGAGLDVGRVAIGLAIALSRIKAVGAGDHFEQQCVVGNRTGQRPDMVERILHAEIAGTGHEPKRRLHADRAAATRRYADRAALVGAEGHVHDAAAD
jgi:hypothetical protein